jgi:hypothetical protein
VGVGDLRDVGDAGHLVDAADFQEVVPEVRLEVREVVFPADVEERVDLEVVVVVGEVVLEVAGVVVQGVVLEVGAVVGEDFEAHNPCIHPDALHDFQPKQVSFA